MVAGKILIMDADPEFRDALAEPLRSRGLAALGSVCGDLGLAVAKEERPEIIIIDCARSQGSGITTLRRLKMIPALAQRPVIVMTSPDSYQLYDQALGAGARACVEMSPDPQALISAIDCSLGAHAESTDICGRCGEVLAFAAAAPGDLAIPA
jgi:two-component system, NtrC family, sensor kinase